MKRLALVLALCVALGACDDDDDDKGDKNDLNGKVMSLDHKQYLIVTAPKFNKYAIPALFAIAFIVAGVMIREQA